jgi:hypothetical protein
MPSNIREEKVPSTNSTAAAAFVEAKHTHPSELKSSSIANFFRETFILLKTNNFRGLLDLLNNFSKEKVLLNEHILHVIRTIIEFEKRDKNNKDYLDLLNFLLNKLDKSRLSILFSCKFKCHR